MGGASAQLPVPLVRSWTLTFSDVLLLLTASQGQTDCPENFSADPVKIQRSGFVRFSSPSCPP